MDIVGDLPLVFSRRLSQQNRVSDSFELILDVEQSQLRIYDMDAIMVSGYGAAVDGSMVDSPKHKGNPDG